MTPTSHKSVLSYTHRFALVAGLIVIFMLAGCFRPAGEEITPTEGGASSAIITNPTLELPTADAMVLNVPTADTNALGNSIVETPTTGINVTQQTISNGINPPPVTPTLPAITIIPLDASGTTPPASGATTVPITVISPGTVAATPDAMSAEGLPTLAGPIITLQFITPGISLGQITLDAPAATSANPSSTPSGLITPTSLPGTSGEDCIYIIQSGDTLYGIGLAEGFSVAEIDEVNPDITETSTLAIGQQIILPGCGDNAALTAPTAAATPNPTVVVGGGETYTVQPGDTLYVIAQENGVSVQAIVDANNLENPERLDIGQILIIPPAEDE